jgi:hypothetical protein
MEGRLLDHFSRQPIEFDGKMLTASRCTRCGTRIIASVDDGLWDKETDHMKRCFAPIDQSCSTSAEPK